MAFFAETFEAWTAADFDAYAEARWRSNRFNRDRGTVRLRLLSLLEQAWARATQFEDGSALVAQTAALSLWTSRDHPHFFNDHMVMRQVAVWARAEPARERLQAADADLSASELERSHPHAGVALDREGLALLWRVPAGARHDQAAWRQALAAIETLAASDAQVHGDAPDGGGIATPVLRMDGIVADLARLREVAAASSPVSVELTWSVPREQALAGAVGVDAVALWAARALPVLALVTAAVEPAEPGEAIAKSAATEAIEAREPALEPAEALTQTPEIAPEMPSRRLPEPRQARSYRPQQEPRRPPPPTVDRERPPIDRIVPPTWDPAVTRPPPPPPSHAPPRQEHRPPPPQQEHRPPPPQQEHRPPPPQQEHRPVQPRHDQGRQERRPPQFQENRPRHVADPRPPGPLDRRPHADPRQPQDHRPQEHRTPPTPEPRKPPPPPEAPMLRGAGRPFELRPDPRERPAHETVAPGARVTLLSGLFAGKTATVTHVAGDHVQVHVGLMAVKVPIGDVRLAQ